MSTCKTPFATNDCGFRFLTEDKAKIILDNALFVLEDIGMEIVHDEAVEILLSRGATMKNGRVSIPAKLVYECLETAPNSAKIYSRDGKQYLDITKRNAYFGGGCNHIYTLDRETAKRRKVTKEDVIMVAKIFDAMPNLDFAGSLGRIDGVTDFVQDILQFHTMATYSASCPLDLSVYNMESFKIILDMAIAIRGNKEALKEKPFLFFMTPPNSPMRYYHVSVERMYILGELGVPCVGNASALSGGTGPATMAGSLVQSVAESLCGLCIHQTKNPGAPYIFCGILANLEFSTGGLVQGCPEQAMMTGAAAEMAHYLDLPFFGSGGFTDAKLCDPQAAIESMTTIMGQAFSGAGLVHGLGYMDSAILSSPEVLVMTDEIIGTLKKFCSEFIVDEDEMAVDVIRDICLNGEEYIAHEHTLMHCRDRYVSKLLDKNSYMKWEETGSKDMHTRINDKIDDILANHIVDPLPADVQATIDKMLADAIELDANRNA